MEKKVPIIKIRGDGGFSVAVFADNKKRDDNTEYVSYSAILQKSWKDKNGEWQQQSVSMFDNNLSSVAMLLQKVAFAILDIKNPSTVSVETKTNEQVLNDLANDTIPF